MTSATRSSAVVRLGALADQLVSLDLDDADAREPSRRQAAIPQIDDAVDLGRLPGRPTFPRERRVLARAVDQDVGDRAGESGMALPGPTVLMLLHDRRALGRDLGRDLVGKRDGGRPLLARIGEDAEPVEARLLEELQRVLERRLGLTREADEDSRADGEPRDRVTERSDDLPHPLR